MSRPERRVRLTFQTKVLAPVLAALVLLPCITLWLVNGYLTRQMQDEAAQSLRTAEAVFLNWLDIRARNLASRYRNLVNEPRFKGTIRTGDAKTITVYLRELQGELHDDNELVMYSDDQGRVLAAAQRDAAFDPGDFDRAAAALVRRALAGEVATGVVSLAGRTCQVVTVPATLAEGQLLGVLTVATRLSEAAAQELKSLTRADLLIAAHGMVTASTIRPSDVPSELLEEISRGREARRILPAVVLGDHFLTLTSTFEPAGGPAAFRYALLSSYEQRVRELERAQFTVLGVSLVGVLVTSLVVWGLIRRITRPLVELRDSAEAVGRGDFTRRIEEFSSDECGALAEAFNQMTENLQSSRADLEKAVQSLKTTQGQLVQSEKLSAVGQFVAGIAHELNNPLTTVIGFSEVLQYSEMDAKHKEYVNRIASGATRCHKIVHSLLGFARQHEPERKLAQLHEIVDAVVEFVSYDMRTNNITIVREFAPTLPRIMADAHQLQQVILNILSNARQAIEAYRRDGQIVLRTGATPTHVWLRIKDNGPGMRRETLSKIFDPFFTTKPQGKGTGLGLSLSYGIIQEHQGTIRAESEPGQGAEFIIELPIAPTTEGAGGTRADSASPFKGLGRTLRVLVVDDEESILHLVAEMLGGEGHTIATATSGQAALELLRQGPYDVIICDWKMPGLSGMQVYEELLGRDPAAARRMLFMTGDVVNAAFQEFLRTNSRACLPKPFALREFHAAVAKLVAEA